MMLHSALRQLRRFHRVKQQDLARQLGISNSYLSEIESGAKAHAITIELLNRYGEIFDVPVSTILLYSEEIDPTKKSDRLRVKLATQVQRVLTWIDTDDEQASASA